jgi:DnaK suppressor protein
MKRAVQHGVVDTGAGLREERLRTVAQAEALCADLADIMASADLVATDDEHDPEGATIAFERSRIDALLSAARNHLVELDRAEQRLAKGSYGVCMRCGARISAERLAARPTAAYCINCAALDLARRGRSSRAG